MASVNIKGIGGASTDLHKLIDSFKASAGLHRVAGAAVRKTLVDHFRRKNSTGNRLGGKRTFFWRAVSQSVSAPVTGTRKITVMIHHPHVSGHIEGTMIRPKKAKKLTIPVHPAAHGMSPRSIPGLTVLWSRQRKPWGLGLDGVPYFIFADRAYIPRDPTALPRDEDVLREMDKVIAIQMRRIWHQGQS